jgi:hypothetical protein
MNPAGYGITFMIEINHVDRINHVDHIHVLGLHCSTQIK